jgi:hypothetical protein
VLLRVSGEKSGSELDLRAVTEGQKVASGLPGGDALTAFVDAALADDPGDIKSARERVIGELGDAACVDAAAVIGNFERMVRIADSTGIPLDKRLAMISEDVQDDLGLKAFGGAERISATTGFEMRVGRLMRRVMPFAVRFLKFDRR